MPSRDGIDEHVERVAIERALTRRKPNVEALSRRFGLSRDALYRHRRKMIQHAPERFRAMAAEDWSTTAEELERLQTETRGGWLKGIRAHHAKLTLAFDAAFEEGDRTGMARISAQIAKLFELIGQAAGEIERHGTHIHTSIVLAPAFMQVRMTLMEALRPYPEARAAAIAALEASEDAATRVPAPAAAEGEVA